jgi:hypothetical protein
LKGREAKFARLSRIDNSARSIVDDDGALHIRIGRVFAWWHDTVPALIWKEVPVEFAPGNHLSKPHQLVRTEGEICWVLEASPIKGLGGRQFVPFFAGYLAASAGRTLRCVYEKRFISHTALTSF